MSNLKATKSILCVNDYTSIPCRSIESIHEFLNWSVCVNITITIYHSKFISSVH